MTPFGRPVVPLLKRTKAASFEESICTCFGYQLPSSDKRASNGTTEVASAADDDEMDDVVVIGAARFS